MAKYREEKQAQSVAIRCLWGVTMGVWGLFAGLSKCLFFIHCMLEQLLRRTSPLPAATKKEGGREVGSVQGTPIVETGVEAHAAGTIRRSAGPISPARPDAAGTIQKSGPPVLRAVDKPYNCDLGFTTRKKWYAVARGRNPGIYLTWEETSTQVTGYSGANHKSFTTHSAAISWLQRQITAMGAPWTAPNRGPDGHRVRTEYVGVDEAGHSVHRCTCCGEIFCNNDHST